MVQKNSKDTVSQHFYRNYRVKIYGNGYNQLVGLPFLRYLFDSVLLEKILYKAFQMRVDSITLKFRRGIKVTIYAK